MVWDDGPQNPDADDDVNDDVTLAVLITRFRAVAKTEEETVVQYVDCDRQAEIHDTMAPVQ